MEKKVKEEVEQITPEVAEEVKKVEEAKNPEAAELERKIERYKKEVEAWKMVGNLDQAEAISQEIKGLEFQLMQVR